MEWVKMKSAPKDRDVILFQNNKVTWGCWDENCKEWIVWDGADNYDPPTHWMIPPEPPEAKP